MNRPHDDTCAILAKSQQTNSLFSHIMDSSRYAHAQPCRADDLTGGFRGQPVVPLPRIIDMENELRGMQRGSNKWCEQPKQGPCPCLGQGMVCECQKKYNTLVGNVCPVEISPLLNKPIPRSAPVCPAALSVDWRR